MSEHPQFLQRVLRSRFDATEDDCKDSLHPDGDLQGDVNHDDARVPEGAEHSDRHELEKIIEVASERHRLQKRGFYVMLYDASVGFDFLDSAEFIDLCERHKVKSEYPETKFVEMWAPDLSRERRAEYAADMCWIRTPELNGGFDYPDDRDEIIEHLKNQHGGDAVAAEYRAYVSEHREPSDFGYSTKLAAEIAQRKADEESAKEDATKKRGETTAEGVAAQVHKDDKAPVASPTPEPASAARRDPLVSDEQAEKVVKPADEPAAATKFEVLPESPSSPRRSGQPAELETIEPAAERAYQSTKGNVERIQPEPAEPSPVAEQSSEETNAGEAEVDEWYLKNADLIDYCDQHTVDADRGEWRDDCGRFAIDKRNYIGIALVRAKPGDYPEIIGPLDGDKYPDLTRQVARLLRDEHNG
jgi:hypothetical protein